MVSDYAISPATVCVHLYSKRCFPYSSVSQDHQLVQSHFSRHGVVPREGLCIQCAIVDDSIVGRGRSLIDDGDAVT